MITPTPKAAKIPVSNKHDRQKLMVGITFWLLVCMGLSGLLKSIFPSRILVANPLAAVQVSVSDKAQSSATVYYKSATKKSIAGDYRGALTDYNRAIQLNPKYADAYNNRGNLKYTKLNDIEGGLADYNRAIRLKPKNANAYFNRSLLKYNKLDNSPEERLRQRAGAIGDLKKAAKIYQQQGSTRNDRAAINLLKKWQ